MADALGLVAGTVPATPLKYSVSLAPGQYAQLDDVVVTQRGLPGRGGIQIAGVVTNVEAMHEGVRFASDVFLIEQGRRARPRPRRDGTRRRSSASTTSAAASPSEPLAATRGEDGRWIGGSVQQWVEELTTAVLDHHAAGFINRSTDDTPAGEALARWATEVVPAVRETISR